MNKLKISVIAILLISVVCCISCNKQDDELSNVIELTVASKKVMSTDWGGIQAERNVVREADGAWEVLFSTISGFQYEDGYEYKLKVRKITPSLEIKDAYTSYELISQLVKERKATVFARVGYTVSNIAKATGKKLTADDITSIENQIKSTSPFNGVNNLVLECTDFYADRVLSQDWNYTTNTGKSGVCNRTLRENEGNGIMTYTFDFDGMSVAYEYSHMGSPTSIPYLILDVTAEYKTQYPDLELAQSCIKLKVNR